MSERNLSEIVNGINEQLRAHGKNAVQEIKMTNKEGKTIGQIRYGYRPQYVFDAINEVLCPENWRYEVLTKEIYDVQAVVEVKLFIRVSEEWFCKGSQVGQMQIVKGKVGDAYKGAITDAIQKGFSLLSIGTDSYRGLLEKVYKGSSPTPRPAAASRPPAQSAARPTPPPETPPEKPAKSAQPASETPPQQPASLQAASSASEMSQQEPSEPQDSQQSPEHSDLPQIVGINFQRVEDRFIATGKVYDKKELLKSAGFKWDGSNKNWFKEASAAIN